MTQVLVVEFQDDAPAAWMGDWLLAAGCRLDVRRAGEDPLDLDGADAVVVLGGSPSANDDLPAVRDARVLVRTAAERQVPTLGICLGHQVCAVALGGEVTRNPRGQQLGVHEVGWVEAAADDPLLGPLTDVHHAVQWNDDVVTRLPDGATLLAATPDGEIQAARLAPTVWGVQWHPEADDRIVGVWAEQDAARHAPDVLEAALAGIAARRTELERDWHRLAGSLIAQT